MPTTSDSNDHETNKRLAALFRQNPKFAEDYFRKRTHAGHSSPTERNLHQRHVTAGRACAGPAAARACCQGMPQGMGYQSAAPK